MLDIRGTATCSLGLDIIDFNCSDDSLELSGLVTTTGNMLLSGVAQLPIGTTFTVSYNTQNGSTGTIPKLFYVVSAFADPYEKTTSVVFGDKLNYNSLLQDPIKWGEFSDPLNPSEPPDPVAALYIYPIHASSIANYCASELGITLNRNPLTNRFSVESFDFSSPFVQILSDLLVSESWYGYLNQNDTLILKKLQYNVGTVPVIGQNEIVAIDEVQAGEVPSNLVTVAYSSNRLVKPDREDEEDDELNGGPPANWQVSEEYGEKVFLTLDTKDRDGQTPEADWEYIPYSKTVTYFDPWGRAFRKITENKKIRAAYNMSFYGQLCQSCYLYSNEFRTIIADGGKTAYDSQEEITYYKVKFNDNWDLSDQRRLEKPEDADEIEQKVVTRYVPYGELYGSMGFDLTGDSYSVPSILDWNGFGKGPKVIIEQVSTTYDYQKRYVTRRQRAVGGRLSQVGITSFEKNTRETTRRLIPKGLTFEGSAEIASAGEAGISWSELRDKMTRLTYGGQSVKYASGRDTFNEDSQTETGEKLDDNLEDEGSFQGVSQMTLIYGPQNSTRLKTYTMPYATDDYWLSPGNPSSLVRGYPQAKAKEFGRIQSSITSGTRNGMNVQTALEYLPKTPGANFVVSAQGYMGLYKVDNLTWTINNQGILLSCDGIFWQPVGGSGASNWLSINPATVLPPAPATATIPTNIIGSVPNVYT